MTDMNYSEIHPSKTRIGWVGTGVMGASMAGHLQRAGYAMNVYNRTPEKAQGLVDQGAVWCATPQAVASASDVIFTIVGYPHDVQEVILGDQGVLKGCQPGSIVVDMTTSRPSLAAQIHAQAIAQEVFAIDAPVSGGDVGARNGSLSIMIGGDEEAVNSLKPIWDLMGNTWVYQGSAGSGQHTKMVNQILIASGMVGVCEALLYGHQAGLDLATVLKSVGSGAAGSWSLSNLAPRIIKNDFEPGFYVEHFIKDMGIAIQESDRMGLALPGLSLARQLYNAVASQGHGRSGTQALQLAVSSLSGLIWEERCKDNSNEMLP